jgi:adenosine deaminase
MQPLITEPNLDSADDFYEALIDAHRDLPLERSHELNAKLVLLLANHIGDQEVLEAAMKAARDNLEGTSDE